MFCDRRAADCAMLREASHQVLFQIILWQSDGLQIAMNRVDRRRSLANCRRYAVIRARPHVTCGKHTGHARLEHEWHSLQRPPARSAVLLRQIAAGDYETRFVPFECALETVRVWLAAY